MFMISLHERFAAQESGYRVVATIARHLLPQVRDALDGIRPSSVLVCAAENWSDGGRELSYRGQRVRLDREVARVEIACTRHQVDRIVDAIDALLVPGSAAGAVSAFCISSVHEAGSRRPDAA